MATTPPPPSVRPHTPPTPLHGARYDSYEPYSPRRSKRSTAHSNPYSSFNADRSPRLSRASHAAENGNTTPPATAKRARFARAPTQLSSPPSSPSSPARQRTLAHAHKTPRKTPSLRAKDAAIHSDSDNAIHPFTNGGRSTMHPIAMLPTPSKTPKKRQPAIASTARILNFQPGDPNDVMPTPRRITKHRPARTITNGFDLYEDPDEAAEAMNGGEKIEIFTDTNARIPELDGSDDNPFVGVKKSGRRAPRRVPRRASQAERERDAKIAEAVRNDEGVAFVFRGRKIFRRFASTSGGEDDGQTSEEGASAVAATRNGLSASPEQRKLLKQAGVSAQRPLTRSGIKPRLLFPSDDQRRARRNPALLAAGDADEAEDEIATDIEMGNACDDNSNPNLGLDGSHSFTHSANNDPQSATSHDPLTGNTSTATATNGFGTGAGSLSDSFDSFSSSRRSPRAKKNSVFDAWQRTKAGAGTVAAGARKRAGEASGSGSGNGSGSGKRARSVLGIERD